MELEELTGSGRAPAVIDDVEIRHLMNGGQEIGVIHARQADPDRA